jgi:cytochrome c oxidase subunit IV
MSSDGTITDSGRSGPGHDASDTLATLDEPVAREDAQRHREPSDRQYIYIALFLAVLTAIEIAATEVGPDGPLLIVALIGLMAVKFLFVILFFMHLRFDSRVFSLVFYIGLGLAVGLYVAVLATFHFFTN